MERNLDFWIDKSKPAREVSSSNIIQERFELGREKKKGKNSRKINITEASYWVAPGGLLLGGRGG